MAVITKQDASRLADKLTSPMEEGVKVLRDAYEAKAYELYLKTIPKQIADAFKAFPGYFQTSESIYIDSYGFSREHTSVPGDGEVIEFRSNSELKLDRETSKELSRVKREWEKERDRVRRTYKKIVEQFPELEAHLPKKYSPPAINYNHLKPIVRELVTKLVAV